MALKELLGPPKERAPCRNCDRAPSVKGALYCEECLQDVESLSRMALRQRHPPECFCVSCMCQAQRQFRRNQATAKLALALEQERQPDPNPPWGPYPWPPRGA